MKPWTTEPLSTAERQDFQSLFAPVWPKVEAKTADVFAFRPVEQPPFMVNSAFVLDLWSGHRDAAG